MGDLAAAKEMWWNVAKLLLRKERVAMSASNDGKVVVRDRSDTRAIWVRPTLRRLAAKKAESGHRAGMDALGGDEHLS